MPTVLPYTVGPRTVGAPDGVAGAEGIHFMHRLSTPDVVVASSPSWDGESSYFGSSVFGHERGADDDLMLAIAGVTRTVIGAGEQIAEWQLVGHPLREGIVFDNAELWMIIMAGGITGTVEPRVGLRVVDYTGQIVRATLLDVGNHGTGVAYAGSNNYIMPAVRAPLGSYTSRRGDRLVLETGFYSLAGGEAQCGLGSRALADPSLFELSMHVMGFQNVGNPGTRCGYAEILGTSG